MVKVKTSLALVLAASAMAVAAPAVSEAATPGQLCRTNSAGFLYTSANGNSLYVFGAGDYVRILDYRGPHHYLARIAGSTGQIERSKVDQSTCV